MQNLIGQSIGRYHIIEQLGEGGMATVYKAYDMQLERDVAIKVIRTDAFPRAALERVLKRFEREAKSMAKMSHPYIVKVFDYGVFKKAPYLVMEYFHGGTLKDLLGRPTEWQEAAMLLSPVARALEYAHKRGVLHRDVKPANILITEEGQPMLTDFGIAKLLEDDSGHTLTGTGVGIGTPEYMAPEQGLGKEIDGRADVYAMGVVLYELVTGRKPFQADTPLAVLLKQVNDPLPRPGDFVPDLPEAVEKVIFKALAKNPEDRYGDMGQFASALEKMKGEGLEIRDRNVEAPEPVRVEQKIESITYEKVEADGNENKPQTKNPKNWKRYWWVGMIAVSGVLIIGALGVLMIYLTGKSIGSSTKTTPATAISSIANTETALPEPTKKPTFTFPAETPTAITIEPTKAPELGIGSTMTREKDGMEMLYVPAGLFTMGSDSGDKDEKPTHNVTLDAYWIDQTEVTNGMYEKCVKNEACQQPVSNKSFTRDNYFGNSSFNDYPVINVNWDQAKIYCEWAGGRLPAESEWEKAARGTDGRTYPWGENKPDSSLLNYNQKEGDTTRIGSFESGKSPYGAYDMAGNVWEWTADWYVVYQGGDKNASSSFGTKYRVRRGGSWYVNDDDVRTADRYWGYPSLTSSDVGFRCARSLYS